MFGALAGLAKGALSWLGSKAAGSALAKGIGSLGAGVVGQHLGNRLGLSAYQDQYAFLQSQGLTPQEIAGGGGFTGQPTSGAVLGNNVAQQALQASQQAYDAEQRDLDRQVMERGQDASIINTERSAAATEASAAMAAGTAANRLAFDRMSYEETTLPKAINDIITSSPEFVMKRLLLTMGEDNLMTSMRAIDSGIDLNDPSTITPAKVRELARYIAAQNSRIFTEAMGAAVTAEHGKEAGETFLGNQNGSSGGGSGTGAGTGQPLRLEITPDGR